jgi:hypothetical protein
MHAKDELRPALEADTHAKAIFTFGFEQIPVTMLMSSANAKDAVEG